MSYNEILEKIKPKLQENEINFKNHLSEIRGGRISVSVIEEIKAECFGQKLSLKQLGSVSNTNPKEIIVQLWDKSYIEPVVKAIKQRNFDLGIRTEENNIYLSIPPLTQESKQVLIKILNEKKETSFQIIRRIRDHIWKEMQEDCQKGEISEDDKYRGKDRLEDLIKKHREKIEQMVKDKTKEIEL